MNDPGALRSLLGRFATGVTVVTVARPSPHGMTANSFTSVSLTPALVLVCVRRDARMHALVEENGRFAISVLAAGQEQLARHFADRSRPHGAEEFAGVDTETGVFTGAPLLGGALAWLECELESAHRGGDHSIFLGRILDHRTGPGDAALIFYRGQLQELAPTPAATNVMRA